MKRLLRAVACMLALAGLVACLAGCDTLEEAKATHGFTDAANADIRWNGAVYKPLPACGFLKPLPDRNSQGANRIVTVTYDGVPVLAQELTTHWDYIACNGGRLLWSDEVRSGTVYCREE